MADGKRAKGARIEMTVAIFLSIAWSAFAFYLFRGAATCDADTSAVFDCLKGNERGDMLAGIFAPLAFIWLVATVLIQSSELKDQRTVQTETLKLLAVQTRLERQREFTRLLDICERSLHQQIKSMLDGFAEYASISGFLQAYGGDAPFSDVLMKESTEKSVHAFHQELASLLHTSHAIGQPVKTSRPDLLEPYIVSWKKMVDQCAPLSADALDRLGYVQLAYIEIMLDAISRGTWSATAPKVDWDALKVRGADNVKRLFVLATGGDLAE